MYKVKSGVVVKRLFVFIFCIILSACSSDSGSPAGGELRVTLSETSAETNSGGSVTVTITVLSAGAVDTGAMPSQLRVVTTPALTTSNLTLVSPGVFQASLEAPAMPQNVVVQVFYADELTSDMFLIEYAEPDLSPSFDELVLEVSATLVQVGSGQSVAATVTALRNGMVDTTATLAGISLSASPNTLVVSSLSDVSPGVFRALITAPDSEQRVTLNASHISGILSSDVSVNYVPPGAVFVNVSTVANREFLEGDASSLVDVSFQLNEIAQRDVVIEASLQSDLAAVGDDVDFAGSANAMNGVATLTIPNGDLSGVIQLSVNGDVGVEVNERFFLTWQVTSDNASQIAVQETFILINDDTLALNDTGVSTCSSNLLDGATCNDSTPSVRTDLYPMQDAEIGRDVSLPNDADGRLGFALTKLDSAGTALMDQSALYSVTPWSCVMDNVTQLIWEVKTASGVRQGSDTLTWLDTNTALNGGAGGNLGQSSTCFGFDMNNESTFCNTQAYINQINEIGLCGYTNWRLPTVMELHSLVDYGQENKIDTDYFPNNQSSGYWTKQTAVSDVSTAWQIEFVGGVNERASKNQTAHVRLVSGGER